jgi:colanic acid/amylovoran biosynthesis glycosyltransferase
VLNAFPVLSETFVLKELLGLKERDLNICLFSLFLPKGKKSQNAGETYSKTFYLMPSINIVSILWAHLFFMIRFPFRYFATLDFAIKNRENRSSITSLLVEIRRDPSSKILRQDMFVHFFLALPLALKIKQSRSSLINAQFADAAASFALLSSKLLSIPYGITMHAYDIFAPQYNMLQKLENALFIFTCTKYNKHCLSEKYPLVDSNKIKVVYHGIKVDRFVPNKSEMPKIPTILSIGRLVPKKGMSDLLKACLILKSKNIHFLCTIVGDGPEKENYSTFIHENDLSDIVHLTGPISHSDTIAQYEKATVFVLPCIVEPDGNRDGIPNVIAEAMAKALPVVSTKVSGIPELVFDQKTGVLLGPNQPEKLAQTIEDLLNDPQRGRNYGLAGRERVKDVFDSNKMLDILYSHYLDILKKMSLNG